MRIDIEGPRVEKKMQSVCITATAPLGRKQAISRAVHIALKKGYPVNRSGNHTAEDHGTNSPHYDVTVVLK